MTKKEKDVPKWKLPPKEWKQFRFEGAGRPKHKVDVKWFGHAFYEADVGGAYEVYKGLKKVLGKKRS